MTQESGNKTDRPTQSLTNISKEVEEWRNKYETCETHQTGSKCNVKGAGSITKHHQALPLRTALAKNQSSET